MASLSCLFSRSIANRKRVVLVSTTTDPVYTPAATSDQLWQYAEAAWTAVSQGYQYTVTQSLFDSMLRSVAVVIAHNGVYINYDFVIIHTSHEAIILTV
ncbi:hypothetical protein TNCV_4442311 [Trichonephila clavipes]|nr:hypothetical protein TNCV_4442311 [Trichonephila clavipes]